MNKAQTIRNVTTLDRGQLARVTTAQVLEAVRKFPGPEFSTNDIARSIRAPEHPVRAAISWLVNRHILEKAGSRELLTRPVRREATKFKPGACEPYTATLYRLKPEDAAVDFSALYRAFC